MACILVATTSRPARSSYLGCSASGAEFQRWKRRSPASSWSCRELRQATVRRVAMLLWPPPGAVTQLNCSL